MTKMIKKSLFTSILLAAKLNFTNAQKTIQDDTSVQRDTVRSVDGNEMIEYLKDVSPNQVSVQCLQHKMCISIEKQFLADKEITTFYDKLELRNITDKCSNTYINSNTDDEWETATHVELCTTDGFLSCGTRMEMNDTHVSYINQIITRNEDNQDPGLLMSPIIREYVIPWHCIYPLEYVVGLETEGPDGPGDGGYYIPEISPIEYITIQSPLLQKENTYPVFMQLFETNNYRTPYTEAPILSNNDRLYVEVKMVGPNNAKIQLVNCWSTPFGGQSRQELENYRFDIIKDYCVTEDASDSIAASIRSNGKSQSSQYEANVFKYNQNVDTDKVYLHCNVRVCFDDNSKCDLTRGFCGNNKKRKRRSLANGLSGAELALDPSITTVHAGPFTLLSDDVFQVIGEELKEELELARYEMEIENVNSNNKKELFGLPLMFVYCFIAIIIIIISLIFGIIFLVIRRKNSKNTSVDKTVRIIEQSDGQTFVVTANGKSVLNQVSTKSKMSPSTSEKISKKSNLSSPSISHSILAASGHTHNTHHNQNSVKSSINGTLERPSDINNFDGDRHSRMTHQTYLPSSEIGLNSHVDPNSTLGKCSSTTERTSSVASSKLHTQQTFADNSSDGSLCGTSRTPSHHSARSDRPIVAKVRQDSYHRMQAHNNNIINAYMSQKK